MDNEELQLLRENNAMLKQIMYYIQNNNNNLVTQFLIDFLANKAAQNTNPR